MGSGPRLRELGLPRGCLPVAMATPVAGRLRAEQKLVDQQRARENQQRANATLPGEAWFFLVYSMVFPGKLR